MYNSNKQNYQHDYKESKEDKALKVFISIYFFITLGLGGVGIIKDIPILAVIAVILAIAIILVPMLLGAYDDYHRASKNDKRAMKIIIITVVSALIGSILLALI